MKALKKLTKKELRAEISDEATAMTAENLRNGPEYIAMLETLAKVKEELAQLTKPATAPAKATAKATSPPDCFAVADDCKMLQIDAQAIDAHLLQNTTLPSYILINSKTPTALGFSWPHYNIEAIVRGKVFCFGWEPA